MSGICLSMDVPEGNYLSSLRTENDILKQSDAHAPSTAEQVPKDTNMPEKHIPQKKRKTRRGKSKRKHPYVKNNRVCGIKKAEAPYNSNQFLLEDHATIEDLDNFDEKLKNYDQASTSTINRTRDSSFSVDSDGEFYSSPDDEEKFLIKDFDDQYETVHAEHLNNMSKADLIQEYLSLEEKVDLLTNILQKKNEYSNDNKLDLQVEIERLKTENEVLKDQNFKLRSKLSDSSHSHSSDSESDSSSSTTSSSSSSSGDSDDNNSDGGPPDNDDNGSIKSGAHENNTDKDEEPRNISPEINANHVITNGDSTVIDLDD